jgi:hypothetical protein
MALMTSGLDPALRLPRPEFARLVSARAPEGRVGMAGAAGARGIAAVAALTCFDLTLETTVVQLSGDWGAGRTGEDGGSWSVSGEQGRRTDVEDNSSGRESDADR